MCVWANAVAAVTTRMAPAATAATRRCRTAFIARILATPEGSGNRPDQERPAGRSEPEGGFEPPTYHLRGGCSTPELLRRRSADSSGRVQAPPPPEGRPPWSPRRAR